MNDRVTPEPASDSCPYCSGTCGAEYDGLGAYELTCINCGRVIADWQPGMPDWETRQPARVRHEPEVPHQPFVERWRAVQQRGAA